MSSAAFGPSAHQKFSGGWRQRSDDCAAPALSVCWAFFTDVVCEAHHSAFFNVDSASIRGLIRYCLIDGTQLAWVWVRRFGIGHGEALISGAVRGHFEDAPREAGWLCSLAGVSPLFSGLWDLL